MIIYAVDDEALALRMLVEALKCSMPDAEISAFRRPADLLAAMEQQACDAAFLDIEMRGMTGLELAMKLKAVRPEVNIIFVTGYSEHMGTAFSMRASGYLLKPVSETAVRVELENLRHPLKKEPSGQLSVRTFGHFEVFKDGKPVPFSRALAKEIFAYLIDRRGAAVTAAHLAAILWEDAPYDRSLQKQIQNQIGYMVQALREVGAEDALVKGRNSLAVDVGMVKCDLYELLSGDPMAINAYCGEYMSGYSWAEMTLGALNQKANLD